MAQYWTSSQFIDYFAANYLGPSRFGFFLGSGASFDSGIPTGGKLVDLWLAEMMRADSDEEASPRDWCTADRLGIAGFDCERRAEFYPQVFGRRFHTRDEGRREIQRQIAGKEPSVGYVILACILSDTRHNIVVTTNFDTLAADALMLFFQKVSLLCGHESIAQYLDPEAEYPAIVQIHGNVLLDPINDEAGTSMLASGWSRNFSARSACTR